MPKVCMWSTDPVGPSMAGPGIRYHRLAAEIAGAFDVTLVAPGEGVADQGYRFVEAGEAGARAALDADVVVAQALPLGLLRALRRRGVRLVFDLYAPAFVEAAAHLAFDGDARSRSRYDEVVAVTRVALRFGDAFLCATERQRDHWIGALAAAGRLTPEEYAADPAFDDLVAVVPFGLDPVSAAELEAVSVGEEAGLAPRDRVLLWGGGIWNWLDPLTVIRAVGRLAARRDDIRLVFLGLTHPSAGVGAMRAAEEAVALASELGLEGTVVRFNRAWVPYADRLRWFARADLGVSAHPRSLESRLAYRTRLLDHIAVGTPLVVTRGDVLAGLVESQGLGRVVPPGDVEAWADALGELLDDPAAYAAARDAALSARDGLAWCRVAEPLARLVERVAARPAVVTGHADLAVLRVAVGLGRASVARNGVPATVAAARQSLSDALRR